MANIVFVLFLLSITAVLKAKDIPPCEAKEVCLLDDRVIFFGINGKEEFFAKANQSRLSGKKIWEFKNFTVKGLGAVGSLPRNCFQKTKLSTIIFRDFTLKNLAIPRSPKNATIFEGLENSLEEFIIINPLIDVEWDSWGELKPLKKLNRIVISHGAFCNTQKCSFLQRSEFKEIGGSSLQRLQITGTCMTDLQNDMFKELKSLEYLELQGNQLTKIKRNFFPKPTKLIYIDLSNNQIGNLEKNAFDNMDDLKVVSLENNKLKRIESFWFEPFHYKEIDRKYLLFGNCITCEENIISFLSFVKHLDEDDRTLLCCTPSATMAGKAISELKKDDFPVQKQLNEFIYLPISYLPIQICEANSSYNMTQ